MLFIAIGEVYTPCRLIQILAQQLDLQLCVDLLVPWGNYLHSTTLHYDYWIGRIDLYASLSCAVQDYSILYTSLSCVVQDFWIHCYVMWNCSINTPHVRFKDYGELVSIDISVCFRWQGKSITGFVLDHIRVHILSILYKEAQGIFSFEFWKTPSSIHRSNHVFLHWRGIAYMSWTSYASNDAVLLRENMIGTSCMYCTSYTSNDAVLLMGDINLAFLSGESSMLKRTSASMSLLECNAVSSVIGERLSGKTKHVCYFCEDALITETIRHHNIPLHPSYPMDMNLHDYAVIASVFFGSTQPCCILLPWGASSPDLFVLQIIYVLLHDLVCRKTTATNNDKFYAASTVDFRPLTLLHLFEMVLFGHNNNTFDSGNVHCLTRDDNEIPESIAASSAEFMPCIHAFLRQHPP